MHFCSNPALHSLSPNSFSQSLCFWKCLKKWGFGSPESCLSCSRQPLTKSFQGDLVISGIISHLVGGKCPIISI